MLSASSPASDPRANRSRPLRPASTSTTNRPTPTKEECPLFMDCTEEPLSEAQQSAHSKQNAAFHEQMKKLEALARAGAKVTHHENGSVSFRLTESSVISTTNTQPISLMSSGISAPATQPAGSYRLLMDPRTGRILGTINGSGAPNAAGGPRMPMPVPGMLRPVPPPQLRHLTPVSAPPIPISIAPQQPQPASAASGRPTANTAVVDLTRSNNAVANGDKSKNFPCINVQPKPQKVVPNLAAKRTELDGKVKQLLVLSPQKFTEWLMQQELVPQQQFEQSRGQRIKLKLGLYQQDTKKYPHSGGYVWVSETNPTKSITVYRGSIFEILIHPPNVVLKLMYHWACQTNINNVMQWVKVDQSTINTYFQVFRCICLAAVQNEVVNLGGHNRVVEIGVISLGTTSPDGNKREVRVEVLGVLDRTSGNFRLRATEPRKGVSQAERFHQIFLPLPTWVAKSSKIVTDNSIDKEKLKYLGYNNVIQSSAASRKPEGSNNQIMDYLKKVVPKMFQNSLSTLSTNQIQQFLDELTFRELYGSYPLECFESLLERTALQTKAAFSNNTMMTLRIKKIAENPFGDWRISPSHLDAPSAPFGIDALPPSLRTIDPPLVYQSPSTQSSVKRPQSDFTSEVDLQITKKFKVSSELVKLESYYYATLQGDIQVLAGEFKADMAFKCHLCKKVFMNNIEFMKHLSLHVESDRASAVDLADLCQCKYCFKDFETPFAMQIHLEEHHWKKGCEFVCRVCEEGFNVKNQLIHHMTTTHVRSEMPYQCSVCTFRTSFHRDIIDHFQEAHDRTDKLQCPRCLKMFTLFGDKGYNSNVASSFVTHMQMHQDKKVMCKKCCLNFHSDKELKVHIDKDHVSFKGFDNLEEYQYMGSEEPIKMPKPDERSARTAARRSGLVKAQQQSAFAAQNLEDMVMYDVELEDCGECGKKLNTKSHYSAYLCCTKCRYSTCCSRAMSLHVGMFHGPTTPIFELGLPIILEKEIFCCCGFKTQSGNKMAKHLGASGCQSAYPDRETAKKAVRQLSSASFAPLISIGDEEDVEVESFDPSVVMAQAYHKNQPKSNEDKEKVLKEQEGPLAFLGLQRTTASNEDENISAADNNKDDDDSECIEETQMTEKEDEEESDEREKVTDKSACVDSAEAHNEETGSEAPSENVEEKDSDGARQTDDEDEVNSAVTAMEVEDP